MKPPGLQQLGVAPDEVSTATLKGRGIWGGQNLPELKDNTCKK